MRMHAPEKIVRQFFRRRLLEANRNAARWIHSSEDVTDCAVFATSIEPLQHNEKRLALVQAALDSGAVLPADLTRQ